MEAIESALAAGDLEWAETIMRQPRPALLGEPRWHKACGMVHMRRRRWQLAGRSFAKISEPDAAVRAQVRLAGNLAAMQKVRPRVYERLVQTAATSTCQLVHCASGELSIVQTLPQAGGKAYHLSPGGEPRTGCAAFTEALHEQVARGDCLGLCGLGDGYLLTHLAHHPPRLALTQQQCVHILENHPEVVIHAMMIHDWTGSEGPIEQERFQWWIGSECVEQCRQGLMKNAFLPHPAVQIPLGSPEVAIETKVRAMVNDCLESEQREIASAHAQYRTGLTEQELMDVLSDAPSRKPRILLITTRFSTVLQHSTRDVEKAFAEMGWRTHLAIEPDDYMRQSRRHFTQVLREFQPDIIFQIDHLRIEHAGLFPPELLFICWIQDDLPNLTDRRAGTSIGAHDFVLTCAQDSYHRNYGYPSAQCVYLDKLTRMPERSAPGGIKPDGPDLVFVSNASQQPEDIVCEILRRHQGSAETGRMIESVCRSMTDMYESGGALHVVNQIRRLIDDQARMMGIDGTVSNEYADRLAIMLSGHLNNALYRQQALAWAADVADGRNLTLELYGKGWEDHPKFARFAKGYVDYGQPLEALTRRAKINLQIVPYSCLHQRLLDGLAAGGFFLVREHPIDRSAREVFDFITSHLTDDMQAIEDVRRSVTPEVFDGLQRLIATNRELVGSEDGRDPIKAWQRYRHQHIEYILEGLPRREEVSFNSRESLAHQVGFYLQRSDLRRQVSGMQRGFVEEHLTYEAGMKRIVRQIAGMMSRNHRDIMIPATH